MSAPVRTNPLAHAQAPLARAWETLAAMQVVSTYGETAATAQAAGIADLTYRARCGFKGPAAAAWLAAQGVAVPTQANQWLPLPDGGLVARLGRSEFLLEDGEAGTQCAALARAAPGAGVYPVLRQDAALLLSGTRIDELLAQTCSVNFRALDCAARPVVLTSMTGVGVTLLPLRHLHSYRLWVDASYGAYLWRTLTGIARELGGGPLGAALARTLEPDLTR